MDDETRRAFDEIRERLDRIEQAIGNLAPRVKVEPKVIEGKVG